jgi:hypothetical protein
MNDDVVARDCTSGTYARQISLVPSKSTSAPARRAVAQLHDLAGDGEAHVSRSSRPGHDRHGAPAGNHGLPSARPPSLVGTRPVREHLDAIRRAARAAQPHEQRVLEHPAGQHHRVQVDEPSGRRGLTRSTWRRLGDRTVESGWRASRRSARRRAPSRTTPADQRRLHRSTHPGPRRRSRSGPSPPPRVAPRPPVRSPPAPRTDDGGAPPSSDATASNSRPMLDVGTHREADVENCTRSTARSIRRTRRRRQVARPTAPEPPTGGERSSRIGLRTAASPPGSGTARWATRSACGASASSTSPPQIVPSVP